MSSILPPATPKQVGYLTPVAKIVREHLEAQGLSDAEVLEQMQLLLYFRVAQLSRQCRREAILEAAAEVDSWVGRETGVAEHLRAWAENT